VGEGEAEEIENEGEVLQGKLGVALMMKREAGGLGIC